jgi:SHS2 domain-containing protein
MPYEFLDDAPTADVGFAASGETLAECFRAAAEATLASMVANPEAVRRKERREVHVRHDEIDLSLVAFLEELVFYKDAESLLLHAGEVRVEHRAAGWGVHAVLEGEPIDPARHDLTGDVKAVTLHRLTVERGEAGWRATVVLDV